MDSTVKKYGVGGGRNYGLDLLRIIAILLIIAHHYSVHGGVAISWNNLSLGRGFIQILCMYGRLACSVFVLISGYYLIQSSGFKIVRRFVPLACEMLFYSLGIYWILLWGGLISPSKNAWLASLWPFLWNNWFVAYYLLFSLFIPFLNPMLKALSKKRYALLLLLSYLVWSIIPSITSYCELRWAWHFGPLGFFGIMYITGAFIRLHCENLNYKNIWNIVFALSSFCAIAIAIPVLDLHAIQHHSDKAIRYATMLREYSQPLSVICAISLFLSFKNLRVVPRPWIRVVAASVLGIYLIHDNDLLRRILWQRFFPNIQYADFPYLHAILKISCVFVACLVIDRVRALTIGRIGGKLWQICFSKIETPLQKLLQG